MLRGWSPRLTEQERCRWRAAHRRRARGDDRTSLPGARLSAGRRRVTPPPAGQDSLAYAGRMHDCQEGGDHSRRNCQRQPARAITTPSVFATWRGSGWRSTKLVASVPFGVKA